MPCRFFGNYFGLSSEEGDMGGPIRMMEPFRTTEIVVNAVNRQFVFLPNHSSQHRLLAADCPFESLSPDSDIEPIPSVINIIGSSVSRSLEKHPIMLHAFESNVNHIHSQYTASDATLDNVVPFYRDAFSLIARGVNRLLGREGHLFGGRYRASPCISDHNAEDRLLYAITNPVKDNLISSVSKSPFFSTYDFQAKGEPMEFWYIDYRAYWKKGGPHNKKHRRKDYLHWVKFETRPLLHQMHWEDHKRQTWVRKNIADRVQNFARERKKKNHTVIGFNNLRREDTNNRPKKRRKSGRKPICHCDDKRKRKAFIQKRRQFVAEHKVASIEYRRGDLFREFPKGSFRPPLLELARPITKEQIAILARLYKANNL